MAANRPTQKRASTTPTQASNSKSALIWGSLAFCSILAVVSLIALRVSAPDGTAVLARATTPPPQQPLIQKPSAISEFEIARLNDAVRALAAERDRLAARVDTLEQSLGDITASINTRKTESKAEEKAETSPAPAPAAAAAAPEPAKPQEMARTPEPPAPAPEPIKQAPQSAAADNLPSAAAPTPPDAAPSAAAPSQKTATTPAPAGTPPRQVSFFSTTNPPGSDEKQEPSILERLMNGAHTAPVWMQRPGTTGNAVAKKPNPKHKTKLTKTPPNVAPLPPEAPERTDSNSANKAAGTQVAHVLAGQQPDVTGSTSAIVGIDLGGETSIDGLRARWAALKGKHGADLAGLRPLVRVREGSKPGTVELHLVAGPVANAGTAARLCTGLRSSGVPCQASEFDGQSLSTR